jgi:hypothetical protein
VAAQDWFGQIAFSQSATSLDPVPWPRGFSASVGGISLWGPFGLQAMYRRVAESAGTIAQHCTFVGCVAGPFDRSYLIRTWGGGLSYDFRNRTDVFLTLGLNATGNRMVERLENLGTGERTSLDAEGARFGLGVSAQLRLRPLAAGIRPLLALRYDRIWGAECLQDASCWPDRNVFGLSAGVAWILRGG